MIADYEGGIGRVERTTPGSLPGGAPVRELLEHSPNSVANLRLRTPESVEEDGATSQTISEEILGPRATSPTLDLSFSEQDVLSLSLSPVCAHHPRAAVEFVDSQFLPALRPPVGSVVARTLDGCVRFGFPEPGAHFIRTAVALAPSPRRLPAPARSRSSS